MIIWTIPHTTQGQTRQQCFRLQQVLLLPGVFKDAQNTDLHYILSLDPDRLLAPYMKAAGIPPKKPSYGSWENTGLDGHIGGHYLSALSNMYASTGDQRLNARLDYMIGQLKRCQDRIGNGYLGGTPGGLEMWRQIEQGRITVDTFSLNGKWVPLYNLHKTMAGLRDAYLIADKEPAKWMLIRMVDFIRNISDKLSDDQIQTMLFSEQGGLNEIFADVSVITGDQKYLALARRWSHHMILDPLIQGEDKLDGLHANMQIPKVVGFERIAEIGGDTGFAKASRFFWETVVRHRTVVIGGNSVAEHFNPSNDFSSMIENIAGPETCNTYNMLKLTKSLFRASGERSYMDFYERALYNHILSSQHPGTGGFVYYTPMRPRHYRVYSQPQICMWCCVGSGMENHGKYGELIYSHAGDDLYVNLFIPSRLTWQAKGLVISQQTNFPESESTRLIIDSASGKTFPIHIRYPSWVPAGKLTIHINGVETEVSPMPDHYIRVNRAWKKGDVISIHLPMPITTEGLPDSSGYLAFLHGPIVLAARTDTTDLDNLFADADQFGGYRARGRLYSMDSMPVLISDQSDLGHYLQAVKGKPDTFIAPDLIGPGAYKSLELIPFYKLHDARYMIYWKKRSPGQPSK